MHGFEKMAVRCPLRPESVISGQCLWGKDRPETCCLGIPIPRSLVCCPVSPCEGSLIPTELQTRSNAGR